MNFIYYLIKKNYYALFEMQLKFNYIINNINLIMLYPNGSLILYYHLILTLHSKSFIKLAENDSWSKHPLHYVF